MKSENPTWPMWPQVAKSGSKYENLNGTRWSSNFDANRFVSPRQAFSFLFVKIERKMTELWSFKVWSNVAKWPFFGQ